MNINEKRRVIQEEALSALECNDYNGIILLPTGTGKSWVMIESLKRLEKISKLKRIWYLCNSTDLRDDGFKEELEKWDGMQFYDRIERICYQSAYKMIDEEGDVMLCDEFDYSLTPKYRKVYENNKFKHVIAVSATLEDKKEEIAESIGKIIYKKELQEVENNGVLNKSKYFFVNYLLNEKENLLYNKFTEKFSQHLDEKRIIENAYIVETSLEKKQLLLSKVNRINKYLEFLQIRRKQFLNSLESSKDICRRLMNDIYKSDKDCKILVFCELNKQADKICKYTYHSNSQHLDYLKKFQRDEIKAIAVCGKVNRGTNIKNVNHEIYESCNQSKTQLTQRLGRGKRLLTNEFLNVYFLIPYHVNIRGKLAPTKIYDWIHNAGKDLDFSNVELYKFKNTK